MVKWVDGKPQERRFSPFFGCAQPFGPFINNQRGLWNPYGGGSANWESCFKAQTTKIVLEPGTSFAGLYAESSCVSCIRHTNWRFTLLNHTNTGFLDLYSSSWSFDIQLESTSRRLFWTQRSTLPGRKLRRVRNGHL